MTSRSQPPLHSTPSAALEPTMRSLFVKAVGLLAVMTLLTGVLYPLLVTAVAKLAFAEQASGSLVVADGHVRGSRLIGQPFDDPRYFWGRPSATTPFPYNAGSSAASNAGPMNDAVTTAARSRIDALRAADPDNREPVPVDLVTSSASGLDPHITPAAALHQVRRVARLRNLDEERIRELVRAHTEGRTFGVLGEPRVNVLLLNLSLDTLR